MDRKNGQFSPFSVELQKVVEAEIELNSFSSVTHARERGAGMDADQLAKTENGMSFGKLGMRASNLQLYYAGATESGEDADDEGMGRQVLLHTTCRSVTDYVVADLQWSSPLRLSFLSSEHPALAVAPSLERRKVAGVTHELPLRRMDHVCLSMIQQRSATSGV